MIDDLRAFLDSLSPSGVPLRLVLLVAPVGALLLTAVGGPGPRAWLVAVTLLLSLAFAAQPESPLGTAALGLVVVWWALAARDHLPASAIPAAWLLLLAHVAAVLLSYGPRELPVDPALARRWVRRAVSLALVAPLVWCVGSLVDGQPEPRGIWVVGLAAAIAVTVAAAIAVSGRPAEA